MLGPYIGALEPGGKLGSTEVLCSAFTVREYTRSNEPHQPFLNAGSDGGMEHRFDICCEADAKKKMTPSVARVRCGPG